MSSTDQCQHKIFFFFKKKFNLYNFKLIDGGVGDKYDISAIKKRFATFINITNTYQIA